MREELILKTAVLAERFYPDLQWYVDSMLTLIERAGDLATKDIWHSTVQIVTNYPALHEYAARKVTPSCSTLLLCSVAAGLSGCTKRLLDQHVVFGMSLLRLHIVCQIVELSRCSASLGVSRFSSGLVPPDTQHPHKEAMQ